MMKTDKTLRRMAESLESKTAIPGEAPNDTAARSRTRPFAAIESQIPPDAGASLNIFFSFFAFPCADPDG